MHASTTKQFAHSTPPLTKGIPMICVVDPQAEDYLGWNSLAQSHGARLSIFTTAEEALRFSRANSVNLWVVNTQLPGLAGTELCQMLRERCEKTPICLVADHYSPAAEQSAWAARATLFVCKPGHLALLDEWVDAWSRHPLHSVAAQPARST